MHKDVFEWVGIGTVFFVVTVIRVHPNAFRDTCRRSLASLEFPKFLHEVSDILDEPPCVVDASARESLLHDLDDGDAQGQLRALSKDLLPCWKSVGV